MGEETATAMVITATVATGPGPVVVQAAVVTARCFAHVS